MGIICLYLAVTTIDCAVRFTLVFKVKARLRGQNSAKLIQTVLIPATEGAFFLGVIFAVIMLEDLIQPVID